MSYSCIQLERDMWNGRTDWRTDSRTLAYHNTSRLKDGRIKTYISNSVRTTSFWNNKKMSYSQSLIGKTSIFDKMMMSVLFLARTHILNFKHFGFECTWWRLFQKLVVRTEFDMYVFIRPGKCVAISDVTICLTNQ
jgi:hypothetical protein